MFFRVPITNWYSGEPCGRSESTACICVKSAKSWVRVSLDNSVTEITRIIFSFVLDRVIVAVRQTKKPKEAGCIACDRNAEKECLHLQPMSRRKALDSRFKAAMGSGFSDGIASEIQRLIFLARVSRIRKSRFPELSRQ